jgi:hypothetical protein
LAKDMENLRKKNQTESDIIIRSYQWYNRKLLSSVTVASIKQMGNCDTYQVFIQEVITYHLVNSKKDTRHIYSIKEQNYNNWV